jgi:AAA domain
MTHANSETQRPVTRPTAAVMPASCLNGAQHQPQHTSPARSDESVSFQKAVKRDAKLRFAVCGPSGSGKTYTLLRLATELGGPVALVDTERGSASKYADLFEFDVLELASFDPLRLVEIIDYAAENGYRVLCIDSLSHFWMGKDGELEKVDRAARRMQTPNGFAAWKQVTPIHNALIDKILSAPLHILVSMRAKTEWVIDRDEKTGKTAPRKIGLAPVMRDGIEYEFDVCGDMDHENILDITKSRCPKLTGAAFPKPGKELADTLKEWLGGVPVAAGTPDAVVAAPPPDTPTPPPAAKKETPSQGGSENRVNGYANAFVVSEELGAMWRRMSSQRGVVKEFEELQAAIEHLAGSTGAAEYHRILRQHGVDQARDFASPQPARMCAKEMYALLQELRAAARENQEPPAGAEPQTGHATGETR